jgi:predicted DNA-binding protein
MKSIKVIPKKKRSRGRPATGRDPVLAVRLPDELRTTVEEWAKKEKVTRSEAIRTLIERGLKT